MPLTQKNKYVKRQYTLLFISLLLSMVGMGKLHAQLIVTEAVDLNNWNADSLVRNILLDDGVTVSNARFNGSSGVINCNNIGIFDTGSTPTNIGMRSGLILASGGVSVAVGPNNLEEARVVTSCGNYFDSDLASIASGSTNDVAVLEFDFVPWDETVSFSFVFGSEEYMEYVGMDYNDVFGFFVDGANPAGGNYNHQNMALIPGTTEAVSINNVNLNHNSDYYINNAGGATIQFDGFTTLLEVSFNVVPMSNYHIKMAIGDVGDELVDSGVFLEAHSFSTNFTYSMTIDDWDYTEIPDNHYFCANQEIEFSAMTNWHYDDVTWHFGDGTSAHGEHVTHDYNADGFYTVTNVLHNPHRDMDSLFLTKVIEVRSPSSEGYATACGSYDWYGNHYTESGTYTYSIPTSGACDSTLYLHLTINPVDTTYLNISACDEYEWYGETYTESGVYTYLEHNVNDCDSLLILNLDLSGSFSSEENVTECNSYLWRGTTYTESGTYTDFVQVPGACDSTFVLNLTLGHESRTDTTAVTCVAFTWHGQNCANSGVYYDTIVGYAGCKEIYVLDLTFVDSYNTYLIDTVCDSYPWPSAIDGILTESGRYIYEGQTVDGCDSIVDLNLTINYTPAPLIAYAEDDYFKDGDTIAVITNTEFFSFQYDFYVEDEYDHMDDWDSCIWQINKQSWQIVPNPAEYQNESKRRYCRVYVAEHDDLPAKLECTVYNNQCEPYSITKRFYLKSSFFGIDEQDAAKCTFDIVPNPNNGTMELRFENMEGKVDVKVYDMMGVLLDNFVIYNDNEHKPIQYNLSSRNGIYFFVANGKEGTVIQKVVVK